MRLKSCALFLFVLSLTLGGLINPASAGAIPGINNLQDLLNRGSLLANGVQIGNDVFYNFSYAGSPAPGSPGAPTPSTILVTSTNTGIGLRFSFPWTSTNANNQASNIGYSVHVVDTVPQVFINGATLNMQSTVNAVTLADNATTTTGLSDGVSQNLQQTVADTTTNSAQVFTANSSLLPVRDLNVSDGITPHSGVGGGSASISYVENIFSQVPEPGSFAILFAAALPLLARRRTPAH